MARFSKEVVKDVIDSYGGVKQAQERLGYENAMTVYNWRQKGLPMAKIPYIHIHTGIPVIRLLEAVIGAEAP